MKKKTASAKAAKATKSDRSAKAAKAAKPAKAAKAPRPVKAAQLAQSAKTAKPAKSDDLSDLPYVWHPKPHPLRKRIPKNNLGHVARHLRALGPNFYVPGRPLPNPRRPDSTYP